MLPEGRVCRLRFNSWFQRPGSALPGFLLVVVNHCFVLHPIPICNQINVLSEKLFVAFFDLLCLVGAAFSMMKFIRLRVFACAGRWTVGYCEAMACGFFSNGGLHLAV